MRKGTWTEKAWHCLQYLLLKGKVNYITSNAFLCKTPRYFPCFTEAEAPLQLTTVLVLSIFRH